MPIKFAAKLNVSTERWIQIAGWAEYEVSSLGRIRRGDKIIHGWKNADGYVAVQLSQDGGRLTIFAHRLVCATFHGPAPTREHRVCHNDGSRDNNREDNLRWGTQAENNRDTSLHGRTMRGERCHRARLTDDDVRAIRRLVSEGQRQLAVARMFGLYSSQVHRIVTREQWSHVE